jgi:hypothetical protein
MITDARRSSDAVGQDVFDLRDGVQPTLASSADELRRRSTPARSLRAIAQTLTIRTTRLPSRRRMR